ncbi:MAG TPA: STAS domain-containing protein [Thermodesulfovibrionales bacterium]|nr:STAS domain-containing protein [Thermodesulfovibrionales bacterium]
MEIKITDHEGVKIISLSGDIDMYTSPEVRKPLLRLIDQRVPVIMIDLTDVAYIDSSGIATFVEGLKGMMSYRGRLKFFGIPERVKEIFNFSKLDRVFDMYGSMEDALKS